MIRFAKGSLVFAGIWAMLVGAALCAPAPPLACAIRWDAWYTNGPNDPAHFTAAALSNPEWRARTPLHAAIDENGRVDFRPTQETFDAEIRAAKQANLCWAYLAYGRDHKIDLGAPMMQGLKYHRSSAIKSKTSYALIVTAGTLGRTDDYRDAVSQVLMLMHDSNYQTVELDGERRPLLFFFMTKTRSARRSTGC